MPYIFHAFRINYYHKCRIFYRIQIYILFICVFNSFKIVQLSYKEMYSNETTITARYNS